MKVSNDLFKFTTADENGGLGVSMGADRGTAVPRAATYLTLGTAATERGGHPQDSHFHKRNLNCNSPSVVDFNLPLSPVARDYVFDSSLA